MNNLKKLISELCPNGVEYKEIGEIFNVKNGYTPSKKNSEFWENGDIPWFRMEDIRSNGKILSDSIQHITKQAVKGSLFKKNSLMVATTATIGVHALIQTDFICNQQLTCVTIKEDYEDRLNIKFYFYYFDLVDKECIKIANQGGGMPIVSLEKMKKIKVPIPPLEIQSEIVRVLDNFTLHTTEITSKLTAEIIARKKQYEYYRNLLVKKEKNKCLSNILQIKNGKDYKAFGIGDIPVYGTGGIIAYTSKFAYDKPSVLIPRKGSLDKLYFVEEPFWNVDTIFYTEINEELVIPKYVYYCLENEHLEELNTAGGVPSLTQSVLNKVEIYVPSLDEQIDIVNKLDKLNCLINDISKSLSTEIDKRQKQYDYYRDQLLSFKEVEINE